jgi:hypothetical protein
MNPQSMEEVLDVWNTFGETPYHPSVSYLVSPVLVASTRSEGTTPVAEWYLEEYVREGANEPEPREEEAP